MPRDGSNIYSQPDPNVVADTTIESAKYNNFTNDVAQDLNLPRPVVAGGTGATSAAGARQNINAEVGSLDQIVTNYDSQIWENGSFLSMAGATSAPVAGQNFTGTCVLLTGDQQYIQLQATSMNTGSVYTRRKAAGVWDAWVDSNAAMDAAKVNRAGDTMTGNLHINGTYPSLTLDKDASANSAQILGKRNNVDRWIIRVANDDAESGSNAGSNLDILRYNDAGSYLGNAMSISRASGNVNFSGQITYIVPTGMNIPVANGTLRVGFAGGGTQYGIILRQTADTTFAVVFENAVSTIIGNIATTGAATAYNTSSDGRLKEDLKSFDAGSIIDNTEVYDFKWKGDGRRGYGVIAQQAIEVYPTAITYAKEQDWYGIDYSKYVPVLLQELKTLRARIAALEKLEAHADG